MGFMEDVMRNVNEKEQGMPVNKKSAKTLREKLAQISEPVNLKVGDLVTWKDGMKNKKTNGLFIVSEVFETPLVGHADEPGHQLFREPLHGKMSYVDSDGDFCEYAYDFRRFEKVDL